MFEVEPDGESGGFCDCCGSHTRTVWGYVHQEQGTIAAYCIQWTVGKPLDTHPANFDLIYGPWGEGANREDRYAISLVHFENEDGPGMTVIDAGDRPIAKNSLVGSALRREDVIGAPLAQHVFAICDAILLQDERLR